MNLSCITWPAWVEKYNSYIPRFLGGSLLYRPMGNETSAFSGDWERCCARSNPQGSEHLIDVLISKESRPTSRTSPVVEFDRGAWLREPNNNNKPQDESTDRLGDLLAARAERRRAYAVSVQPVEAVTFRQFTLSFTIPEELTLENMCRRKSSSRWRSKEMQWTSPVSVVALQ